MADRRTFQERMDAIQATIAETDAQIARIQALLDEFRAQQKESDRAREAARVARGNRWTVRLLRWLRG